jgi:hypothetical protein
MSNPLYEIGAAVIDDRHIPDTIQKLERSWHLYCDTVKQINELGMIVARDPSNLSRLNTKEVDSSDMCEEAKKVLHHLINFCENNLVPGMKLEIGTSKSYQEDFIQSKRWYSGCGGNKGDKKRPKYVLGTEPEDNPKKAFSPIEIYNFFYDKFCGSAGRDIACEQLAKFIVDCRGEYAWSSYAKENNNYYKNKSYHEDEDITKPILPAIQRFKTHLGIYKETVKFRLPMQLSPFGHRYNSESINRLNKFLKSVDKILTMESDNSWNDYENYMIDQEGSPFGVNKGLPGGNTVKFTNNAAEIKFKRSTWEIIEKFIEEHLKVCKKERENVQP